MGGDLNARNLIHLNGTEHNLIHFKVRSRVNKHFFSALDDININVQTSRAFDLICFVYNQYMLNTLLLSRFVYLSLEKKQF